MQVVEAVREDAVVLPPHAMGIYKQGEVAKFMATASADGIPNVALIVSQMPVDGGRVVFGEFMMVKTLANLKENPRFASLAVTEKLAMAGFKGTLEEWTTSGPYSELINSIDFFRYNAYMGIRNIAITRIDSLVSLPEKVSFLKVGREFAHMNVVGPLKRGPVLEGADTPLPVRRKFNGIMSIKALAYNDDDGYPGLVPAFGVHFRSPAELLVKVSSYNESIRSLALPAPVALNVLTLDLLTYQVKGSLLRFDAGIAVINITEAYSSMPPFCGQRIA